MLMSGESWFLLFLPFCPSFILSVLFARFTCSQGSHPCTRTNADFRYFATKAFEKTTGDMSEPMGEFCFLRDVSCQT